MAQNKFNIGNYEKEICFDIPIEYNGLILYPVKMIDYFDFFVSIHCFLLDRFLDDEAKDNIFIYQMTYLEYLIYQIENYPERMYITSLTSLLSLVLQVDLFEEDNLIKLFKNEKGKPILEIYGEKINSKQFDEIKQIVCLQNDIDLSIYELDPRVRNELQKTIELQNKSSKSLIGSLEDQIISLCISTSLSQEDIQNLSIRKFKRYLQRVDCKLHYEIYKAAQMSGFVEIKDNFPHWTANLDKNISTNVVDYDKFTKNDSFMRVTN